MTKLKLPRGSYVDILSLAAGAAIVRTAIVGAVPTIDADGAAGPGGPDGPAGAFPHQRESERERERERRERERGPQPHPR